MKENLQLPTLAVGSTPRLQEFNPRIIPFQMQVLNHLRSPTMGFDYDKGVAEILLSGSVGSAKSILAAHIVVTHAFQNPGSQQIVLRRTLKDLKATIWRVLLAHWPRLRDWYNKSEMTITFPNGSVIYGLSYDDGNYEKFRSYELSGALIEEATEAKEAELYDALLMRVGRLPHIRENYLALVTNPDSPGHWIYNKFMENPTENRKVFYSLTEQNPFLKPSYIKQLKASLTPKMAKRMLEGQWIEIADEVVYSDYDSVLNYKDEAYVINQNFPVHLTFDFNVAEGKPMSAALGQFINGTWHWFADVVVEGARTLTLMEEIQSRGYLDWAVSWVINGDATGKANVSASLVSNYDIIYKFLSNYRRKGGNPNITFERDVPVSNPPIKTRHNIMNIMCHNTEDERRFFVYRGAPTLHKGMKLTALKKGASYVEDDSKDYQHVTTAVGYAVWKKSIKVEKRGGQGRS